MLLNRNTILQATTLPYEDVEVAEWGGTVRVRGMTGRERDALEQLVVGPDGKRKSIENFRGRVVATCAVDDSGMRLFTDADAKLLGNNSAAALERVFTVALRLSGLSATDVADLEKNSEDGQSEFSTSD